jgi:pimeloyl-ACP methyl ester carboxylesterase
VLDGPPALRRSARDPGTEDPPLSHYREVVARSGMNAFRREWRRHPLLKLHQPGRAARTLLRRMLARYPGTDLRRLPTGTTTPMHVVPEQIRRPTLVLCGEKDLQQRATAAEQLVRRLPHGEYRRVAGAGHLPNLDAPRDYCRLLDAFLRRHPGPGGR